MPRADEPNVRNAPGLWYVDTRCVRCDAALSGNDGDSIFLVCHLPENSTLLAYFGHQPQPGAGSHLRTKKTMKAISPRTLHQIGRVALTPQPTNSSC